MRSTQSTHMGSRLTLGRTKLKDSALWKRGLQFVYESLQTNRKRKTDKILRLFETSMNFGKR